MINIALIGYGKMGQAIEQVLLRDYAQTCRVMLRIGQHNDPAQGLTTWQEATQANGENPLKNITIALEFSRPESAVANLVRCLALGVPVVCGTTAWHEQLPYLEEQCAYYDGTILYASNFSLTVNIMLALNKQLAAYMYKFCPNYQVHIEEVHHTQKIDAPSGTAIALAQGIMSANPSKQKWVNNSTKHQHELAIISERLPNIPGTHTVIYQSPIDHITLQHLAHTREGFAQGAVAAALWLIGKKGIYTMNDVLNNR